MKSKALSKQPGIIRCLELAGQAPLTIMTQTIGWAMAKQAKQVDRTDWSGALCWCCNMLLTLNHCLHELFINTFHVSRQKDFRLMEAIF